MDSNALEGLRVIDLSRNAAGAYATLLMAGFGAEVILVEQPEGHPFRHRGPYAGEKPDQEKSLSFLWYCQGKKSVIIELDSEAGRDELRGRIAEADIVVESFSPGRLEEMKLGYDALREANPQVILASITPFGQTGPYRHFQAEEITVEALSGQMYGTGSAVHPPLCSGPPIAQMTAGLHAYIAVLTAIRMRDGDGRPRHIDVSIHEAGVDNMELRAFALWRAGKNPTRQEMAVPAVVPWKAYPCRDGWAAIHGAPFRRWRYFARLFRGGRILESLYAGGIRKLEESEAAAPGSLGGKRKNRLKRMFLDHLDFRVRKWAAGKTRDEILNVAKKNGLAFGVLRTLPEILELPQHKARNFFRKIDHPAAGSHLYCGAPFPMSRSPWQSARAPLLGEHNGRKDWMRKKAPGGEGTKGPLPLSGFRVIDLTLVEAAPHGTRMLADFGAEVIKVEYPARLDVFRGTALGNRAYDRQPFWAQLNRNKRSVTLDLKSEAGMAAFHRLVAQSDAVVANFRDGTLERLGIDYGTLKGVNSGIILVSMSAYGNGGPDSDLPSYGGVIEVMSGVQNLTARPGGNAERIREIDILNGVAGAAAILTALAHRDRTGRGQQVHLSQAETTTHALMGESLLELAANGVVSPPAGNRNAHGLAYQGCFPCRGEDSWLTICLRTDDEWRNFCDAIGQRDWKEDPRFDSTANRLRHNDSLDEEISEWTRGQDSRNAMKHLQNAGIAAGAVLDLQGVVDDRHLRERDWFIGSPENPETFFMGFPFAISGITPGPPRPGPALGEGNEEILGTWLGIPEDERPEPKPAEIRSAFHLEPYLPPKEG